MEEKSIPNSIVNTSFNDNEGKTERDISQINVKNYQNSIFQGKMFAETHLPNRNLSRNIKNTNDSVKSIENMYSNELKTFKDRSDHDSIIISGLKDQIEKLHIELNDKSDQIINLQNKLQNNEEEYRKTFKDTKNDYEDQISRKSELITTLSKQVKALEQENNKIRRMYNDHLSENVSMKEQIKKNINEGSLKLKNIKEQRNSLKIIVGQIEGDKDILNKKIKVKDSQILKIQQQMQEQRDIITTQEQELNRINIILNDIRNILSEYVNGDEFVSVLREKVNFAEESKIEIQKLKSQLIKLRESEKIYRSKSNKLEIMACQLQADMKIKSDKIFENENKYNDLMNKCDTCMNNKKCIKIIVDSYRDISKNILEMESALYGLQTNVPIRTIILSVIMVKRWKTLTGSEKKFQYDARNWWWMDVPNKWGDRIKGMVTSINCFLKNKEQFHNKLEQIEYKLMQSEEQNKNNEEILSKKEKKYIQLMEKYEYSQRLIKNLEDQVSSMIDPKEYFKINKLLENSNEKVKTLYNALNKSNENIMYYRHESSIYNRT